MSDLLGAFGSANKLPILISLILLLILIIMIVRSFKGSNKKDSLKREINYYLNNSHNNTHVYSGNVSLTMNGIRYQRGNRSNCFEIPISKTTYLAPFMIDPWFENRNYNEREANRILDDISYYLTTQKIVKNAIILSDEEYDNLDEYIENH